MTRRWAMLGLALAVAGCTPTAPTEPPRRTPSSFSASPSPSPSPSASPTPTPTLTATPTPDSALPLPAPIGGALLNGNVSAVVQRLHDVAGHAPVLKLDVTAEQVVLTALYAGPSASSYRWRDGKISRVETDFQYLGQATFDPLTFPLDSARRLFDIADLRGVRGEAILQVVEYRDGAVLMSVTSRPASTTVFFRPDGTAVAELGVTSVADIAAGIAEVVGASDTAYAVGFDPVRGYWADVPDAQPGVVLTRNRVGGLPVFATRRTDGAGAETFDPGLILPAALAQSIASFGSAEAPCTVTIDMSLRRSAPVARYECGGQTHYTDLHGRDMTKLVTG